MYEYSAIFNNRISLFAANSRSAARPQLHTKHILPPPHHLACAVIQLRDTISNGKIQQNIFQPSPRLKSALSSDYFSRPRILFFGAKYFLRPQPRTLLCICFPFCINTDVLCVSTYAHNINVSVNVRICSHMTSCSVLQTI